MLCPVHDSELEEWRPPLDQPEVRPPDEALCTESLEPGFCWNCGAAVPNERNSECLECDKSLTPPAVQLRLPNNADIELGLGEETVLGRVGPHAELFREYPNVSRRHARIGVDWTGAVWVEPSDALNGTFVNEKELTAGRHPCRTRARLRLAMNVECMVRIFPVAESA
jgi:hypothetical protein